MKPKVTVSLVTWNGAKFIDACFTSLFEQSFKDFDVIAVDNGSKDNTVELIKKFPVPLIINLIINKDNLGFAKAHNQAIRQATGEYVLVLNQDVTMAKNFLEELVRTLDTHPDVGSVGGKLLRASNPKIIDTAGMEMLKSRQVIDRGADTEDKGQHDEAQYVFGISGAAVLYRKSALEQTQIKGEFFDEDFFSYKEDVDLAFRLQSAKWKAYYQPSALGWHHRGSGPTSSNPIKQLSHWRKRSNFLIYHSYKNHLFTIIKNESPKNILLNFFQIAGHEIKKFLALLIFKPRLLTVSFEIIDKMPRILAKRREIQKSLKK